MLIMIRTATRTFRITNHQKGTATNNDNNNNNNNAAPAVSHIPIIGFRYKQSEKVKRVKHD